MKIFKKLTKLKEYMAIILMNLSFSTISSHSALLYIITDTAKWCIFSI